MRTIQSCYLQAQQLARMILLALLIIGIEA